MLTCGYLAAVFLTAEAHRAGVADLEQWSRRRAVIAAAGAGAVAIVGLFVLHHDARRLFVHLLDRGWPLVAVSTIAGLAALLVIGFAPLRNRPAWARPLSALAVAAILAGWGVAQYPYLLGTHVSIYAASAPTPTMDAVGVVALAAVVFVVPSLAWLLLLTDRGRLGEPTP